MLYYFKSIYTACVIISVILMPLSFGEMYTSLLNVKQAISVERQLIDHLETYIEHESERLEDIKRFYAKVSDLHSEVYSGPSAAMANPLVAFTLIKRLQSEWLNLIYSDEAQENTQAFRSGYEEVEKEGSLPKLEDLQGAAKGLMRLQDVYALQVGGLVRGHFQRITDGKPIDIYSPTVSVPLSGDDCFLVGKVAYELEDYYHSVQWLEESVRLFRGAGGEWSPENEGTLEDALDHLAFSHFKTGNISYALSLSQELLNHDPMNVRVLKNVQKYERLLVDSPPLLSTGLKRPNTTYLRTRNTYERLCRTQGTQPTHYENPRLFCDYFNNDSPGLLLQPIRREVLSLQPYVVLYHSFITDSEAESIRDLAQTGLRRSVVASGEEQATAEYRISKSAWLKETAHPIIGRLDQRITLLTGLNVQPPYAEYLQVVNYGIGGHYEPHFDHATLSSVDAGGSTAFIHANFSVPVLEVNALHIMLPSSGGTSIGMVKEMGTLCMLAALSLLGTNGWLTNGSMSTARSSRDDVAPILRSEKRESSCWDRLEYKSQPPQWSRAHHAGREREGEGTREGMRER